LVFAGRRKVIFIHGCFWHGHSDPKCKIAHRPRTNEHYWSPKLERNQRRDEGALAALSASGWDAMVIWECETRNRMELETSLRSFLGPNESGSKTS
jgi:DNA mismatch endonuclease (patch repair protein)